MARLLAVTILLFVVFDAAVCPAVCLNSDSASHQGKVPARSSSSPSCGGVCSSVTPAHTPYVPPAAVPVLVAFLGTGSSFPAFATTSDIYHPPR